MPSQVVRGTLRWLLPLLLAATAGAAPEIPAPLPLHPLPLNGALSQNSVTTMLQDRSGLMWFGTLDSVDIYDGYEFRALSADPRDPNALSGVQIARLFEDRDGYIWVAGFLGWLDRVDPRTGKIRHFPRELFGRTDRPPAFATANFIQTPDRAIWIGTGDGLHRYDPASDKVLLHADAVAGRSPLMDIRAIVQAAAGKLWVATGSGLFRFEPRSRTLEAFHNDPRDPRSLPGDIVTTLHIDPDGTLWVGTTAGLARWDGDSRGFTRYMHDAADPRSINGNWVMDILRDRDGRLWVACQNGGGLNLMQDGGFQHYLNNKDDPDSISLNDVWSLVQDRSGLIWIGTAGAGLSQVNPSVHRFHALRAIPFNTNSLSNRFVWGIDEDREHRVWMTTLAGLESYDPATARFHLYTPTPNDAAANQLQSVHVDRVGRFWVGSINGRLYRFDPATGAFTAISDPKRSDGRLSMDRLWHFAEDSTGRIWLSTTTELLAIDPASASIVQRIPATEHLPLAFSPVRASLVDSDGALWLGGGGAGLIRMQDGKVTAIVSHDPGDPHSLSDNGVRSLHESKDGDLWIGTQNGLNRMSAADRRAARNRFALYTKKEGLPDNTIYGIQPDRGSRLWLSTNRGLSLLDPDSGSVQSFDSRDGLVSDEMNGGAELAAADGTLYFGGVDGVSWFKPADIPRNDHVPQVRITHIDVAGKALDGQAATPRGAVDVDYNEDSVTLAFAAMDFHQPGKNRFRYRLIGQSDAWTETTRNSVSFAKLADGRYRFEVLGSNNDGVWSAAPATLGIVVRPPWWRSSIAYAIYAILFVGSLLLYDRKHRNRLRREREFSESLASAHSLAEANHQMALRYAQFDSLTQLPNRASLIDALGRYIRFARAQQRQVALLLINLDRFQRVNDTFGHNLGDLVIKVTAERLQQARASDDYLARAGSDEFALIAVRPADVDEDAWIELIGARLAAVVGEPHAHHDPPLTMTASVGVALYSERVDTPSDLFGFANIAMHVAKREGGKRLRRYQFGMIESARERLGMEVRIRNALQAGEFVPWFQPIIDLRRNRLYGFEALIRWQPKGQKMIFPDQFIPIAEESELIVDLGNFMIGEVCRQLAVWKRRDIHVSVNVSLRQLRSRTLIPTIQQALAMHGVPAECLKVEITESSMMENVQDTADQLHELKKLGVQISIDDFGTGFSSMSHLRTLPVDEMKIDRSFISDVVTSQHNQKIVNSIVRLAHELQLAVVAEGVEDERIVSYLRSIDCDLAQGYYFGRPKAAQPIEEISLPMLVPTAV